MWARVPKQGARQGDQSAKRIDCEALEGLDMVKIGVEVQVPVGTPVIHEIHSFELEQKTVADLRKGE